MAEIECHTAFAHLRRSVPRVGKEEEHEKFPLLQHLTLFACWPACLASLPGSSFPRVLEEKVEKVVESGWI